MVSPEWMKKSGRFLRIAEKVIMPPSSGLMPQPWPATSPPQTKLTSWRSAGAVRKRPIIGSPGISGCDTARKRGPVDMSRPAGNIGMRQVAEADAIEHVLARGQVFQQHLGSEVAFRQRGDRRQGPRV